MFLLSPRAFGYQTWLQNVASTDTPAIELTLTGPNGDTNLYIKPGEAYVLPESGLILGFHLRYANGSTEFFALDHPGHLGRGEHNTGAGHLAMDANTVWKMITNPTPANIVKKGIGFVLRHSETGQAIREAAVCVVHNWNGAPENPGYYSQSDGTYLIRGFCHL